MSDSAAQGHGHYRFCACGECVPADESSAAQGQYEDTWESSDGLSYAECKVIPPGDPWPAMVSVDAIDLSALAEHDARSLAAWLTTLADVAHRWNRSVSRV